MIYLDCAATSLQKPRAVGEASMRAMRTMASPGRGGHRPAMLAADAALDCRINIAELFNVPEPEQVVFTLNATHALNIAINSLAHTGESVVISGYEHNSVTRPLHARGLELRVADTELFDTEAALERFERELRGASLCVTTMISNVFGYILPVEGIAALCREHGVPLIIDASQAAGCMDIDFTALGAEFIAMPGHKGLLGPQGTGVLLCRNGGVPLMQGGTGSASSLPLMPDFMPDMLEAGTHNITGIAGLDAGVSFVRRTTPEKIGAHERRLMRDMAKRLRDVPGIRVYLAERGEVQSGVLSIVPERGGAELLAEELGKRDVAIRAGLHCAPSAHMTAGTIETGTARFSFSPFNTPDEVHRAVNTVAGIVKNM